MKQLVRLDFDDLMLGLCVMFIAVGIGGCMCLVSYGTSLEIKANAEAWRMTNSPALERKP